MAFKTKDLKMTFLGITPILHDETGTLKPQDIVALSALMTFKGKAVKDLYREAIEKGQDINKKVKTIIRKSSLRGHASIATTPAICFTYEASKFIDLMMTGMVFSSSLMASGRRTDTTVDDVMYPSGIDKNSPAKKLYTEVSQKNINFFNKLLASNIEKDDASKALQYGIYGTGIIAYPIESVLAFKKEAEANGDWMPEEALMVAREIEKYADKMGVGLIYASRELAARNFYPYPNIFKDPGKINIVREIMAKNKLTPPFGKLIDSHFLITPGLEKNAGTVYKLWKEITSDKKKIKKRWRELLKTRQEFIRDYNAALQMKVASAISWRVWSDRKRHRTVPMMVDSLYYSVNRCRPVFRKFKAKILNKKLNASDLREIDRVFTIPLSIGQDKGLLYELLVRISESVETYFELLEKFKIKPSEAVFIIPRGLRIDILQTFDLHNLVAGFYPLRTCTTADTQLRMMARNEMLQIKEVLRRKGLSNLEKLVVTKCHIPGFCLEEKNCPIINGLVKDYDEKFHEEMKAQLDEEFEQGLAKLGKA